MNSPPPPSYPHKASLIYIYIFFLANFFSPIDSRLFSKHGRQNCGKFYSFAFFFVSFAATTRVRVLIFSPPPGGLASNRDIYK